MKRVLTGIQPSGQLHWGNYFGAIQPMLQRQSAGDDMFFFIADLHAFTTVRDPEVFKKNQRDIVLDYLALGLDPEKSLFWRQSDVPAHTEAAWYLLCLCSMGALERAHSFKDKVARGLDTTAGLFTYPMLMAADILLYDADVVPVGKDQKQHVEMARDIAQKFNHQYGDVFKLPEPEIAAEVQTIPGLDGQKMSKSYGNTISIFEDEKKLKKQINSIETASVEMGTSLDPESCTVFSFHKLFKNPNLVELESQYRSGSIGYGGAKKQLFELVWDTFAEARARRENLADDPMTVEAVMKRGAEGAAEFADAKLATIKKTIGIA